jgi:SAM-dependent methyltransferase
MPGDAKQRFSDRVDDYVRYRPRYPAALFQVIEEDVGLDPSWVVADVGSGTGLSAELFLDHGSRVFAVEPNAEMREAAERLLRAHAGFTSVPGSAENTGLDAGSVDIVVAGQAFHWFDPPAAREEFSRILRPPKWVALFWNARHTEGTAFLTGYEALLQCFGTDYAEVRHEGARDRAISFFRGPSVRRVVPNEQALDRAGLRGRVLSSSYMPAPGQAGHEEMLQAIDELFVRHASGGSVSLTYDTEVFIGSL